MSVPTLTYLGRVLALTPASLGERFHDDLTVNRMVQERPSAENGWTKRMVAHPSRNYWYAKHHETSELTFYALAGYGPRIEYTLRDTGLTVIDGLPCGLPTPDFSRLVGTEFRGSQQEVFFRILKNRTGIVKCSTGWGKSYIISRLAKVFPDARIVVTVSSIDIARDFYNSMKIWDANLGFVGDGSRNPQRVTVAVAHSLRYCDLEWTNLLLADECHTLGAEGFMESLGGFRRAKFIGFSASPEGRSDGTDGNLEALFGPLIAEVPYSEAVDSGNVVPITVLMFECATGPQVDHLEDHHFEREAIWNNVARNRRLAQINEYIVREFGAKGQILNMVSKTEHAFRLQQLMPDFKVVHGAVDADKILKLQTSGALLQGQNVCTPKQRETLKKDFETGALRRAIATSVWSKGVNFQDLEFLVRGDGLASTIESTQVPGRLSRLGSNKDKAMGYLCDTYDSFSRRMENRSKKRITEYRKHGWTIRRVSL